LLSPPINPTTPELYLALQILRLGSPNEPPKLAELGWAPDQTPDLDNREIETSEPHLGAQKNSGWDIRIPMLGLWLPIGERKRMA